MTLTVTILGCGSSGGVPRVGSGWGACDPQNPKNRRRRCSVLVERSGPAGKTTVLVDTSPDLREQLLRENVQHLDGVLYTHEHADHTHGIDDLRPLAIHMRRCIDIYTDARTSALLRARFGYCFVTPEDSDYPPIVVEHHIAPDRPVHVEGAGGRIEAWPFRMQHGRLEALGFRFDGIAYASDVSAMPEASLGFLQDLDVLILDALRYTRHPTHFNVAEALALIERVKPRRAILTNLHTDLDYERLRSELPPSVEPAYDGMRIAASAEAPAAAMHQRDDVRA
ncbi:MBL fold metallo-hydrolase [Chelatococcus sp. SYSU_G07232]|uniref:MBL fold metallo-hydrolase n=1 Tax=Chelatococcus albus TaxID=3047466 RepID=A0ABT7ABQ5_9HYPH|nr:MBL fold metallo-hydrolase [Chelatococcus sp. SYSU_G07232]MDJ1156796.1 MBL fold metallo-hydrolase [Chelatococcus sp. SYSU_G07232]